MNQEFADIANKAADHMENAGSLAGELWPDHARGESYQNGDSVCMVGAMQVAMGALESNRDQDYRSDATIALGEFIDADLVQTLDGFIVSSYNDSHTHEQRVQMLRDFAVKNQTDEMRSS